MNNDKNVNCSKIGHTHLFQRLVPLKLLPNGALQSSPDPTQLPDPVPPQPGTSVLSPITAATRIIVS